MAQKEWVKFDNLGKVADYQKEIMDESKGAKGFPLMDEKKLAEVEAKLKENPNDFQSWATRGILWFNYDDEKAIESFNRALCINPWSADQYYNRGRKYLTSRKWLQGLTDCLMAVRLDPYDDWRWHFVGVAYYWNEMYDEAIEAFERSVFEANRMGDGMITGQKEWGWMCYAKKGDFEGGAKWIEDVTEETRETYDDRCYKKRILLRKGLMSVEEFKETIDYNSDISMAIELYGLALYYYYTVKDVKKAVEVLDEILSYPRLETKWGYKMAQYERPVWIKELNK